MRLYIPQSISILAAYLNVWNVHSADVACVDVIVVVFDEKWVCRRFGCDLAADDGSLCKPLDLDYQ